MQNECVHVVNFIHDALRFLQNGKMNVRDCVCLCAKSRDFVSGMDLFITFANQIINSFHAL